MSRHTVETCADDPTLLQERLDELTAGGAEIVSVMWQQRRVHEGDLSDAMDSSGSFVIVARSGAEGILRERPAAGAASADPVTVGPGAV